MSGTGCTMKNKEDDRKRRKPKIDFLAEAPKMSKVH